MSSNLFCHCCELPPFRWIIQFVSDAQDLLSSNVCDVCVCVSLWALFSMHSFGLSTYQQWLLWANLNIKQMKSEFRLDATPQTHQRCCLRNILSLIRWLANIFVQVSVPMCTSCTSHRSAYLRCDNKNHTIHSGGLFHFGLSFGRVDKLVSLWWLNKRYEKTIKYFWSFNIRHR